MPAAQRETEREQHRWKGKEREFPEPRNERKGRARPQNSLAVVQVHGHTAPGQGQPGLMLGCAGLYWCCTGLYWAVLGCAVLGWAAPGSSPAPTLPGSELGRGGSTGASKHLPHTPCLCRAGLGGDEYLLMCDEY